MKLEIVLSENSVATLNNITKTKGELIPVSIDEVIEAIISIYGVRYLRLLKNAIKIALKVENEQ
jgi:hypothetical protein